MNRKCPICGADNKRLIYSLSFEFDENYPLPCKNDIVLCKKCGFVYADNDASQDNYDRYYKYNNTYNYSDEVKYNELNDNIYGQFYFELLKDYINYESTIIDVGCGDGSLLDALKLNGYHNITGFDPSLDTVSSIESRGINAICGNIFSLNEKLKGLYDVVISTGVAEHIYDLKGYVNNISNLLKKDGLVCVVVPAVEGFERFYTPLPNYFNHEHINYFSVISLDNLFGQYGFIPVEDNDPSIVVEPMGESIIFRVYEKKQIESIQIKYDSISEVSVNNYLLVNSNKEKKINNICKSLGDTKFILWGTGSFALQLVAERKINKDNVAFCVDNNLAKQGSLFAGKKVYSPEYILSNNYKYPILICSMQNYQSIINQVGSMGIKNKCISFGGNGEII